MKHAASPMIRSIVMINLPKIKRAHGIKKAPMGLNPVQTSAVVLAVLEGVCNCPKNVAVGVSCPFHCRKTILHNMIHVPHHSKVIRPDMYMTVSGQCNSNCLKFCTKDRLVTTWKEARV